MELLFARQLIPPQTNGRTAGKTAWSSSDLKKLHHLFHWARAFCSFLHTRVSSPLHLYLQVVAGCSACHSPADGAVCCWLHTSLWQALIKALRLNTLAGWRVATALAESSNRKTRLSSRGRLGLCRATHYSKSKLRATSDPNHRNQNTD